MQKTAYEGRISDWSSDVCSSDLKARARARSPGNSAEAPSERSPARQCMCRCRLSMKPHRWHLAWVRIAPLQSAEGLRSDSQKDCRFGWIRSEEHTSELQSLMRTSYAVCCLKKKKSKCKEQHTSYMQRIKIIMHA